MASLLVRARELKGTAETARVKLLLGEGLTTAAG